MRIRGSFSAEPRILVVGHLDFIGRDRDAPKSILIERRSSIHF
ncbi:hypothetical protein SAMN02787118_11516 [Streptomyces mirabilis]|uniref:Uncharacterized protein n=1 Tax=Streptomyces mirabilis TaxID=68239 RepID=A0A1I2NJ69_9ACTN|nr:hypothetical protein SAMN02787118_11516 [Streptomyces mirabilis]